LACHEVLQQPQQQVLRAQLSAYTAPQCRNILVICLVLSLLIAVLLLLLLLL
jgi:hypothetical protein